MADNTTTTISPATSSAFLQAINPATQEKLPGDFRVASYEQIEAAAEAAHVAWQQYQRVSGADKARFLRAIATEIEALGPTLVERAVAETGLPAGRITGERGRTCNQLRSFAKLVEQGDWVEATIDEALPHRLPAPRPDLRKMLVPLGPVAVFTASNFPLAFSTAGGDTAAALAAGCPVIVKAHAAHPGTNDLVAGAILTAAEKTGMPSGVFTSLHGGIPVGERLVLQPSIRAVGFTGSHRGGMALTALANSRPEPIPVYAEMGSNNPIFLLPDTSVAEAPALAETIANSVNLGAGQFCTNPGFLVVQKSPFTNAFIDAFKESMAALLPATMLNEGIFQAYDRGVAVCATTPGVDLHYKAAIAPSNWISAPAFAQTSAENFLNTPALQQEVFGPFTLLILCENSAETIAIAQGLQGQLTATIMGDATASALGPQLLQILQKKAGRVIFNGVPTGVEVCPAMHHGGPYPATSNAMFTSVGIDATKRFARPVTFQDCPDSLLPPALQANNPLGLNRSVNGQLTN